MDTPQQYAAQVQCLVPPERFQVDSDRLDWPLSQQSGVPGLPDNIAIMPHNDSHAAVLKMPCASGKTYSVRRDLVPVASETLVIVVTCNRLFTRATCADWEKTYGEGNVYCYLDGLGKSEAAKEAKSRLKSVCERGHGVLFISIESFHVLGDLAEATTVGALLLEETCELASKMLSATCPCVTPFRLLREVAHASQRIIYTDADFEADGNDHGRCVRLARYLRPELSLRIFTLSGSAPHIKRTAKLYFDHADADAGSGFDAWWAQLKAFLGQWKRTGDTSGNRVAVACPSLAMVRRVCSLARTMGLYWCDYTSETSDVVKNTELAAPAEHWTEVGLVAFTQTLSVGADPVGIQFAAVFLYVAPVGCSVRCLLQGVLRFGRDVNFKLLCTTVYVCMRGRPLQGPALVRHEERMQGTSYYQRAMRRLQEERHERLIAERSLHGAMVKVANLRPSSSAAQLSAFGGSRSTYVIPDDGELEIAAWACAEEMEQREDPFSVLRRGLLRHGWEENDAAIDTKAAAAFKQLGSPHDDVPGALALHDIEVEKQVSSLKAPLEQFEWALQVVRGGTFESVDAFHDHCYGLVEMSFHSSCEKVLLKTWALVRRLPREVVETMTAAELMFIRKRRDAIELHALGICVGSVQLYAQEAVKRVESKSKHGADKHAGRLWQARKLELLDEVASLLMSPSSQGSFFADPGSETQQELRTSDAEHSGDSEDGGEVDGAAVILGTAKTSVVRALEAARRGQPDDQAIELLEKLQAIEINLGLHAEKTNLASTIRRICRAAYVQVHIKTRKVEMAEEGDAPESEAGNAARRLAKSLAATSAGPTRKKPKREAQVVAVIFARGRKKFTSAQGESVLRDYALDWKVESPHAKGIMANARDWQEAHSGLNGLIPSELRQQITEELGLHEEAPNPPGQGPHEDRPLGNARSTGVFNRTDGFVLARKPRSTAEGYLMRDEALPWERMCRLEELLSAQLSFAVEPDMRTVLERGRRVLDRLKREANGLTTDAQGFRWKPTFYARRMPLGRLTAGASSMQPMPNLLRQWLYRGLLHDIDFVNAHPTIMLGLVKIHRPDTWQRDAPGLAEYVDHRSTFLDSIVRWYGLPDRDFAKTAILVAINGGELHWWRRKVKSPASPLKSDLPQLLQLQREALWVRDTITFLESPFAASIDPLKDRVRALKRNAGRTEEELSRSAFSYVIGHLESMALEAACKTLEEHGFRPTSLIYDGCLVMHNPDGDLGEALTQATSAVTSKLGFSGLELKEKDMFNLAEFSLAHVSREAARQAALQAARGDNADPAAAHD